MLYALDLFSGIGGNSLALKGYAEAIAYCEADPHAQAVLISRMAEGSLPRAPICTDVCELDGREFRGLVDIIVAGFPCQDISCAGKGAGLEGKQSGLFFEIVRLAKEIQPAFLFLENVPGIRTRGLDRVIQELTALGYDLRWTMLSAADVGAPHKRERWFCVAAHTKRHSSWEQPRRSSGTSRKNQANDLDHLRWPPEPRIRRMDDGVAYGLDRIKRLGNAVVPAQAKAAFEMLMRGHYGFSV